MRPPLLLRSFAPASLLFAALVIAPFAAAQAPEAAAKPAAEAKPEGADRGPAAAAEKARVPYLRPAGAYADLPEMGFSPLSLLGGGGAAPKSFFRLIESIDALAKVPESMVVLDLSGDPALNLPQLREVERALQRVRAAKKQLVCYVENVDAGTLQIAAQCDRVLMAEMGAVDLCSPSLSVMHMRDALDLLGIQVEVTRVGAFKGAVEPYVLPQMSDHLRAHYEAMLQSMNADVVRRIAQGRKLPEATVRQMQSERLFTAKQAKDRGLVDELVAWSGAERAVATMRGGEAFEWVDAAPKKKAQSRDLMALISNLLRQKKEEEIEDPQIVVMHLAGQIVDGDKPSPGSMVSGISVAKLDELAANDLVKAVVVRINSPGGSATASEAIRMGLERLAAKKPVVFSMGSLAASGGYWITTIGRPILAEVGTITGSIGVFGMRFQTGALMRRLGVHTDVVRLDDGPLMDAMDRPWTDAARGRMQGFVDDIYDRFLANVAASRKTTREKIDAIAGGRVWSGQQAVENGLVDAIGGVDEAVAMVRKEAKLGDDVEVVHVPEPKNFADSLFASMFDAQVAAAALASGRSSEAQLALLRAVLGDGGACGELLGVVHDALTSDGRTKIYALMPGLRVR